MQLDDSSCALVEQGSHWVLQGQGGKPDRHPVAYLLKPKVSWKDIGVHVQDVHGCGMEHTRDNCGGEPLDRC